MTNNNYKTIKNEVQVEQQIQKSKFIAYLRPVSNEEEAKEFLKEIKKNHPKATHHCSAFRIGDIERSNDDGEPSSSAGLPMLQVLRGHDIQNVAAVVVRYYGGILLGVGGLIRAYGSSVTLALESAIMMVPKDVYVYQAVFPYASINDAEFFLSKYGEIIEREYRENTYYTLESRSIIDDNDYSNATRGLGTLKLINSYKKYVEEHYET